ncbi:uncharacterized protein LOC127806720 [Diospyros lotus]|uniref:uncharacterized protein LOC127806720 n=1 Tax=Diospyros lotus TaxID=55363 RepID=UPI0022596174|nr:uncharacterized protein LOC127806720 [Diospyros lotus]
MMIGRVLSQTLRLSMASSPSLNPTVILYASGKSASLSSSLVLSHRILSQRNRSNQSGKAQLVEVDLDSTDSPAGGEVEVVSVRKLEEVIHNIIVRRSAPDWLPFLPGSSYWVPPRPRRGAPSGGVVEVVGKYLTKPLSDEERRAFSSLRGWPSSAYFIEGSAPMHPVPMELKVEVKIQNNLDNASESDDEEG